MSSTSGGIRIVDLPDIGAVTEDSSLVGEHAGSGRFTAPALRDYVVTTGGGPFLPLAGGNLTGNLTTSAPADITAGRDMFVTASLHVGPHGGWEWSFAADPDTGSKVQTYQTFWADRWDAPTGKRSWNGPIDAVQTELMGLSGTGELTTRVSVTTPYIHSTGDILVDGTMTADTINAPGGTFTGDTIAVTGNISCQELSVAGSIHANLNLLCDVVYINRLQIGAEYVLATDASSNRYITFQSNWQLVWAQATGNLSYYRYDGVMLYQSIGWTGDFGITGNNAFKPGGGSWAAPSDSRIKTVTGDYTRGLAEIKALAPKRFTYRGNDTTEQPDAATAAPYKTSPHYMAAAANTEFAGLVAQDLEAVMPEMVSKSGGYIDGVATNDIMTVDRSSLDLALVNAIKELEARLAALEAVGMAAQRAPVLD